jgi:hypothetical protein
MGVYFIALAVGQVHRMEIWSVLMMFLILGLVFFLLSWVAMYQEIFSRKCFVGLKIKLGEMNSGFCFSM